jgi:hypothetical protein
VACRRRAETQQILAVKFVERAQQMMLIPQPAGMLGDDGRTIAIDADPKRVDGVDGPRSSPRLR